MEEKTEASDAGEAGGREERRLGIEKEKVDAEGYREGERVGERERERVVKIEH